MKTPTKTVEFIDLLKARRGWTDYRVAKELGWHQTTVSKYRRTGRTLSGEHALQLARALEMPEAYVLACVEAEREPAADVARVWRAIAETLSAIAGKAAAITLIGAMCLLVGPKASAAEGFAAVRVDLTRLAPVYIMRTIGRAIGRVLEQLLTGLRTELPVLQIS